MSLNEAECANEWLLRWGFPHHIRNSRRRFSIYEKERRKEEREREREMEGFDLVWFGVVGLVLRKREDRFGGTTSTAKEEEEVGVAALHVCDFLAFGVSLFLFL